MIFNFFYDVSLRFFAQRLSIFEKITISEDEDESSSSSSEEDEPVRKLPFAQRNGELENENADEIYNHNNDVSIVNDGSSTSNNSMVIVGGSRSASPTATRVKPTTSTTNFNTGSPSSSFSSSSASATTSSSSSTATTATGAQSSSSPSSSSSTKKRKVQAVPLDEQGNAILPFTVSGITVHNLGKIVYDREAYHSDKSIWPVGYESTRLYHSTKDPNGRTTYRMRILDGGETPIVRRAKKK